MSDSPETQLTHALDVVQREQAKALAEARLRREERQRAFEAWAGLNKDGRSVERSEALEKIEEIAREIVLLRQEIVAEQQTLLKGIKLGIAKC